MITTYADYLLNNPNVLVSKDVKPDMAIHGLPGDLSVTPGLLKYYCPNCNLLVSPELLIDVRDFPISEDWACDGCWTKWMREGRNMDGGASDPEDHKDWEIRWAIAHDVPLEIIQKLSMSRRPDKYKKGNNE